MFQTWVKSSCWFQTLKNLLCYLNVQVVRLWTLLELQDTSSQHSSVRILQTCAKYLFIIIFHCGMLVQFESWWKDGSYHFLCLGSLFSSMAIPADSIKCKGKRIPTTTSSSPPSLLFFCWEMDETSECASAETAALPLLKNGVKRWLCLIFQWEKR